MSLRAKVNTIAGGTGLENLPMRVRRVRKTTYFGCGLIRLGLVVSSSVYDMSMKFGDPVAVLHASFSVPRG